MKDFLDLCESRFAVRKFTDEPVSNEDLEYIKSAILLSPSAANRQPWKFLIVTSEEGKDKLRTCYDGQWFRTAPMYFVCMKNPLQSWERKEDGKCSDDIDVAIATEHLCLAAADRGLGTCWVCHFNQDLLKSLFPVQGYEAVAIVPVGHIAPDCPRAEKDRKSMKELFEDADCHEMPMMYY
ncbi:MAG: nitroreductase family protein [Prevotella sp.]